MSRFEDLPVWQRARELRLSIRDLGKQVRCAELRDQMTRAAIAVMARIAEGSERGSRAEFRRSLAMARGSCGELRSHLIIARDDGFIDAARFACLHEDSCRIGKLLGSMITSLVDGAGSSASFQELDPSRAQRGRTAT